jgi:hypothetical protein
MPVDNIAASNVAPHVAPNVAPHVVPNVVSNVAPNIVPDAIPNDVPTVVPNVAPNVHQATWPIETDLILVPGTTRVMLTHQLPLLRSVIHDAFEGVRVSLLFGNSFPDATVIPSMTRDALVEAAESHERASNIHQRLLFDEEYATSMIRLVSHYTYL